MIVDRKVVPCFAALLSVGFSLPDDCVTTPAVVIGAGISGLAAARELVGRGCRVLILEAQNRVGGRMETVNPPGFGEPLDLHASFIHGDDLANSVFWLTQEFGIETFESGGFSYFRGLPFAKWVKADGEPLTDAEIAKGNDLLDRWYDTEAWNLALAYEAEVEDSTKFDMALKFIELQAIEKMRTGNGNAATIESEFDEALLDFHLTNYFDNDWGLSRRQHSVRGFSTDWDFTEKNGQDRTVPDGVEAVTDALLGAAASEGDVTVELGAVVTKVRYDDDGCTAELEDGTAVPSGACIVTIPLAVMKDNPNLFEPELPNVRARSVDRTGIGGLNKLFVKWRRQFWESPGVYYVVGGDGENPFSTGFHTGEIYGRAGSTVTQHFFGGDLFAFGGLNNQNAVKDAVVEVMRGLFPLAGVTKNDIVEIKITNHRFEENIRGSYSAPGVYMEGNDDRRALAEPLGNILFFAGEHTNTEGRYQTMDGAYDTGVRAAGELCGAEQNRNVAGQNFIHKNPNQPGNPNL